MSPRHCDATAVLTAIGICLLALTQPANATSGDDEDATRVAAIWHVRHLDFTYSSPNTYYSCGALQEKLGSIMRAVGASEHMAVQVQCSGTGLVRNARAHIAINQPVEATDENVRAATTYDSSIKLLAHMRQIHLPTANELPRFPAEWRTVSLTQGSQLRLEAGDCDLLRGLRDQVFPKLAIRVANARLRCSSWSATRLKPLLEVTALMPAQIIPIAYAPR